MPCVLSILSYGFYNAMYAHAHIFLNDLFYVHMHICICTGPVHDHFSYYMHSLYVYCMSILIDSVYTIVISFSLARNLSYLIFINCIK